MQITDNARAVLNNRYLKKDPDTKKPIEEPDHLFRRVADHVALAESEKDRDYWANKFYEEMTSLRFMPNSPTLMNAGREMGMLSACFVLPVEDSIEGIFSSIKATAMIQKAGGGTGFSFSRLRPKGDLVVSSGGSTSGPLSFIDVFSKATDAIQQGAFRRGANMGVMRIDHPDVIDFITVKDDRSRLQNYNISIAVTDEFLQRLEEDPNAKHRVRNPRNDEWKEVDVTVSDLWDQIIEHAHGSGEPGLIFIDRINATNPIKNVGEIEATNPCWTRDTEVLTTAGPVPFGELADQGNDVEVLCVDDTGTLSRQMMRAPRRTAIDEELAELSLHVFGQDGISTLRATPGHNVYCLNKADGGVKTAKISELQRGDIICSLQVNREDHSVFLDGEDKAIMSDELIEQALPATAVAMVLAAKKGDSADVFNGTVDNCYNYFVRVPGVSGDYETYILSKNCGEQPLHPYDSCNLGSLNLGLFVTEGEFDWEALERSARIATRFLDNVITVNKFPVPELEEMSRKTRRIGLGVMGFADALFKMGIAYDSLAGQEFGAQVMEAVQEAALDASHGLGVERGNFEAWSGSDYDIPMRNSYRTTVAPTGTISIIANCSGGIEPLFSLAFIRQVMKDENGVPVTMTEVNPIFREAAEEAGIWSDELLEHILENGTLKGFPGVPQGLLDVFVCAHDISPEAHIKMQAAFQQYCDSAISKTINFPHDATVDDVRKIYELAIESGLKGVTVYRDGCRDVQPMALKEKASEPAPVVEPATAFAPEKLPEIMSCIRIRQMTPFGNMHVKISVDPKRDRELEVFAQLGKGGDTANSDLEAICRILSLYLRSGGTLELALSQIEGIGSSMSVPTKEGRIMSLPDGLATALKRYAVAKSTYSMRSLLLGEADLSGGERKSERVESSYKVKCPECGANLSHEEGCIKCHSCGYSKC